MFSLAIALGRPCTNGNYDTDGVEPGCTVRLPLACDLRVDCFCREENDIHSLYAVGEDVKTPPEDLVLKHILYLPS